MKTITSSHNQKLKELRKLHDRKHRERTGLFLAEGEDMLAEARRRGSLPRTVLYDAERLSDADALLSGLHDDVDCVPVSARALRSAGSLGSGARVIGVFEQNWSDLDLTGARIALYLHEVSDPGNVGTVLRAAHALAPSLVVLSPGAADPFGPKAVRASMGAVFGQRVARASFEDVQAKLGDRYTIVALSPRLGRPLYELDLGGETLFCLGSERYGLPDWIAQSCDEVAHVPLLAGGAESINVAMTAVVCLYESAVQPHSGRRP